MEEYALLSLFRPPLTTWVVEQVRVGTYHMLNREGTELRRFSNRVWKVLEFSPSPTLTLV